ncbi:DDE-type integrase/transposase/recombinase [Micromonospora sp. NPDC047527]|uniref:DDE-type integrase/transposase/recombinase n=1 Tax=Micromonospora sp. NPDC047527 TaxID=3155144 RepID=UPI0033F6F0A4
MEDLLGQRLVERLRQTQEARQGPRVGPPVNDDLVKRDFTAHGPNRLWLADITEHRTGDGKLYLCAIKDMWSNRIVGYCIDSRMKSRLAITATRFRPTSV